jgi:hypothetical protein
MGHLGKTIDYDEHQVVTTNNRKVSDKSMERDVQGLLGTKSG